MASVQSVVRKLVSSTRSVLFVVLLIICIHFWPDHDSESPSTIHLAPRGVEVKNFAEDIDVRSNATLLPRDTFQCSQSKPCSNGACCGGSGYCGYGPTYCGSGCVSNCGAVAECGKYAKISGQQCPLNTCCSQFGFCGTTEKFCSSAYLFQGCQSIYSIALNGNRGMPKQLRAESKPARRWLFHRNPPE